jgi:hypothetical protein
MFKHFGLYLAAPGDGVGSGGSQGQDETKQDLADLDAPESEPETDDEEAEVEKDEAALEDDDEEKEEPEAEAEGEEKDDDKEEVVEAKGPATLKDIKAKYPNLFKEFPQLKSAFFLTPQFLEIFPDTESAKEAAEKVNEYNALEQTLVARGDPRLLVNTLGENNPKALRKIVENFGEAVRAVSPDDYIALSAPIIEELIYHAAKHGVKTGNKNLELAARHLANFVYANGGDIPDISKRAARSEPSDAEKQLVKEREGYQQKEFTRALGEVGIAASNDLDRILGNKLDGLTSFEKRAIMKDARAEVDRSLGADKAFQNSLRALWARAADGGYSDEAKSRIKRAWLDRARLIAPGIRNRLRQEALGARNPSKGDSEKSGQKRPFMGQGAKTNGKAPGFSNPKKIDWAKTSDRDILDS